MPHGRWAGPAYLAMWMATPLRTLNGHSPADRARWAGASDPDLVEPDGTCHLAASASCWIIERVAEPEDDDPPPPTIGELAELRVWSGPLDDGRELADTTVASARRLTAELATIVPFDALTWPWADTFH